MYERFTERARKVIQLAKDEAERYQHEYIAPEHILLALLSEGWGIAANFVDSVVVRTELHELILTGPAVVADARSSTLRAKQVIEDALLEARNLGHDFVDAEHLLLALIRADEGAVGKLLKRLGLHLDDLRETVRKLTPPPAERLRTAFETDSVEELRLHLKVRLAHLRKQLKLPPDLQARLPTLFKEVVAEMFPIEGDSRAS